MRRPAPLLAILMLLGAPLHAAEEGASSSLLIQPQFGTMFWTLVIFLILAFLLGRFAWKPLLGAVDAREKGIRDAIDESRRQREEAHKTLEEHRALVTLARKERAEAVEAGRQDALRLKADILDEARKQREQLMAQAETQIAAGLRQARAELRGEAADLAIQAASRLMGKNLDDATQRRLVEDYLAELERLGASAPPH
ncbi:MAG TPA: F0F1 ATP synthase subunit B [Candidatus Polarisedimenticolaceae bacterium]|nr:F0F1 ATP synthase subunit B [Candidatus Polarisedimenticolaceae bacterium]